MGRHLSTIKPAAVIKPVAPRGVGPRSRRRGSLFLFAFTAAFAFVLVTVIDPYSGATASPYFQMVGESFGRQSPPAEATQELQVDGTFANTVVRDDYTVTDPPPPPPPPPAPEPEAASAESVPAEEFSAPEAAVPDPGSAQAYAYDAVASRGWGEDQYGCLVSLWDRESGWRVNAMNTSSGAYGIPQALPGSKMASSGGDWETNAATQIEWGLGYVSDRYGSPCGAWAHSEDNGWY